MDKVLGCHGDQTWENWSVDTFPSSPILLYLLYSILGKSRGSGVSYFEQPMLRPAGISE